MNLGSYRYPNIGQPKSTPIILHSLDLRCRGLATSAQLRPASSPAVLSSISRRYRLPHGRRQDLSRGGLGSNRCLYIHHLAGDLKYCLRSSEERNKKRSAGSVFYIRERKKAAEHQTIRRRSAMHTWHEVHHHVLGDLGTQVSADVTDAPHQRRRSAPGMKLQENGELHASYSSPDIIRNIKARRLRWAEHVARLGESRNAYRVLFGRPEGKRPLGRPRCRWEDNIKMDLNLREVGYDDRDWINLAQDRDQWRAYAKAAMNLRYTTDWSRLYITNSSLQGDTFLTLAGLLISYVFLNRMRYRISGFNILLHYLHRFIRLTPAYAMVVLFEATLKSYLSSSPLFQQAADVSTSRCQTNWWTNLLFINNYVNADSSVSHLKGAAKKWKPQIQERKVLRQLPGTWFSDMFAAEECLVRRYVGTGLAKQHNRDATHTITVAQCSEIILFRRVIPFTCTPFYVTSQLQHNYIDENLLYISNISFVLQCMIQSWYISLDMQLFLLSPLLLYPLWKWPPRRNIPILVVLTLAGFAAPFAISYVEEYSANLLVGNWQKREEFNQYLYGVPQARFGPWVIGMAFGYFIHEAKRKQFKLSKVKPLDIADGNPRFCFLLNQISYPIFLSNPRNRRGSRQEPFGCGACEDLSYSASVILTWIYFRVHIPIQIKKFFSCPGYTSCIYEG
ncbi:hypothetical protein ANN_13398 [Periplaneta americana]|uniref:Acyltransferase 3 domain-containing protein n=1 Tax=Periplaneta americana TaxID=6978 RepID=A0ABQ8TLB2_PERAM|nr:hypothetical protein ANN_13398 [Periplaneta americana]